MVIRIHRLGTDPAKYDLKNALSCFSCCCITMSHTVQISIDLRMYKTIDLRTQ